MGQAATSDDKAVQLSLPFAHDLIVVHCFFRCKHIEQSADPQQAHDMMERHYAEKHSAQIDKIVNPYKRQKWI